MTTINGFEIALSEQKLDDMINNQMIAINMVSSDFEGYKSCSQGVRGQDFKGNYRNLPAFR